MNYQSKLTSILHATGWSQEQLAYHMGVSFATLNSWINGRSQPRAKALSKIEQIYLEMIGVDNVNETELQKAKSEASKLCFTPETLVSNKQVLDTLTLYLTYHTNTIEGSTMTLSDVEEVIFEDKVLSNRTAIEQAEARNHQAALHWLIEQLAHGSGSFTIDESLILGIHLRLMNGIIGDAGQYRRHGVRIMGAHVPLANWAKIPDLLERLVSEMNKPSADIVSELAKAHAQFEKIHPFSDGNGRAGRLLMLAQALRLGFIPPLVVKERKHAYYKYLEQAQTKEEIEPLELFVAESMMFSFKLLSK